MRWLVWSLGVTALSQGVTAGCKARAGGAGGAPTPTASAAAPSASATVAGAGSASSMAMAPVNPVFDVRTDAAKLLQAYKDNEVRADPVYKGMRVRMTGFVGEVKRDITHTIYVTVGTGDRGEIPTAQCFFSDARANEVAALKRGDKVTVDCTCKGLMMNVLMADCEFPTPTCAMRVCDQLSQAGVASNCQPKAGNLDEVDFSVSALAAKKVWAQGDVLCLPGDAAFQSYRGSLKEIVEDPKAKLPASANPYFASPSARAVVSLLANEPVPPDVQAKTKAVVDSLESGR